MVRAILILTLLITPVHADWILTDTVTPTVSGDQTIATPRLNGLTPTAAYIWVSGATAFTGTTPHLRLSFGVTDGTDQFTQTGMGANALTAAPSGGGVRNVMYNNRVVDLIDINASTTECSATVVGMVSDGVQINWGTGCDNAYVMIVGFAVGVDADAGSSALLNTATPVTVTGVAFQADSVHTMNRRTEGGPGFNVTHNGFAMTWGLSVAPSSSMSAGFTARRNVFPTESHLRVETTQIAACDHGCGSPEHIFTVDNYGATSFRFNVTLADGNAGGEEIFYLATRSQNAKTTILNNITLPGTTGTASFALGIEPQYLFCGITASTSTNTGDSGTGAGFAYLVTDFVQTYTIGITDRDNATTTNRHSYVRQGLELLTHTRTVESAGTLTSSETGVDINLTTNATGGTQWACTAAESEGVLVSGLPLGVLGSMPIAN